MPTYGPGRTPLLGLLYGSDAGGNANLDRIDTLLGKLAGDAGLLPPDPVPEEQPAPEAKITVEKHDAD